MDTSKRVMQAGVALACAVAVCLCAPVAARADDIDFFDEDVVVTYPQQQQQTNRSKARSLMANAARSSQTGTWVEVKRSEGKTAIQTCAYYIYPNANPDGSVKVDIKTDLYCKSGSAWFTTTKTIYDNGNQCAYIGEDWKSLASPGQTITQKASFSVRGGGSHHITSIETVFRDSAGTYAGWDFYIDIPYVISSTAGTGGTISPSGHSLISAGSSKEYTIKPSSGYRIKDVTVDGKSVGTPGSYKFTNVVGDHTISASFQKTWNVTFKDGVTGETLGTQTVDDGTPAKDVTPPDHEGWSFVGWDKDTSKVGSDLTVTATYEPIISVRVPAVLPSRILADGTVVVPSDYVIENLSVVKVRTNKIEVTGMPADAKLSISRDGTQIHTWEGADTTAKALQLDAKASQQLAVSVSPVTGTGEWRERAQQAALATTDLCSISYTFEWAK